MIKVEHHDFVCLHALQNRQHGSMSAQYLKCNLRFILASGQRAGNLALQDQKAASSLLPACKAPLIPLDTGTASSKR